MSEEFIAYVMELLGPFGTVATRRMFGGHGVYLDGLMFALVSEDTLYLKADEMNRVEFEQAGCEIFGYSRSGKHTTLGFFRAPEDAMESPELMLPWARTAYAAALRTNAKKQVAKQTRATRKVTQSKSKQAAPTVTLAKPATKQPAKKVPTTKTAVTEAKKRKTARPATRGKPAKRT